MKMNICFATDENYLKPTALAIMTILLTNKDDDFTFYILSQKLSCESQTILKETVKKYSAKSSLEFCFLTDDILQTFSSTIKKDDHVSLATYLRLFLPSFLPESVDKILYIDGDTICTDSLEELYSTDLTGFSMAACTDARTDDTEIFNRLDYPLEAGYFTAGLLLINIDYWRKNDIQNKCLKFISENKSICTWHDQDALNKVLAGTIKKLHLKYATPEAFWEEETRYPERFEKEIEEARKSPVIIHCLNKIKPWNKENKSSRPMTAMWLKLYKKLFGQDCKRKNVLKGKERLKWLAKGILCKLHLRVDNNFSNQKKFNEIKPGIEKKYFGEDEI